MVGRQKVSNRLAPTAFGPPREDLNPYIVCTGRFATRSKMSLLVHALATPYAENMKPKSYPEMDRREGKTNIEKSDSVAKTAAALFADLFWDQYLYNKRSGSGQIHIDDNGDL
jgi:hypothetical protein